VPTYPATRVTPAGLCASPPTDLNPHTTADRRRRAAVDRHAFALRLLDSTLGPCSPTPSAVRVQRGSWPGRQRSSVVHSSAACANPRISSSSSTNINGCGTNRPRGGPSHRLWTAVSTADVDLHARSCEHLYRRLDQLNTDALARPGIWISGINQESILAWS
jgi:hypothetical protein